MKTYLTCTKCGAYAKFQFQKHIYRDACDPSGKYGRHIQDPKYTYVKKNEEDRLNRKGLRKPGSRRELQDAKKAARENYGEKRCAVCANNAQEAYGDKAPTWRNQLDLGLVYCHKCAGRRDNDAKCMKVAGMTWEQLVKSYAPRRHEIWGATSHIPAKVGERNEQTYRGRQRGGVIKKK